MSQSINIPVLSDFVQAAPAVAVQAAPADQAPVKYDGHLVELFAFGTIKLAVYFNETLARFEVYTTKGFKLAHSQKSAAHAKNGSRNEIVKRQRTRKVRAEKARAAKLAAAA